MSAADDVITNRSRWAWGAVLAVLLAAPFILPGSWSYRRVHRATGVRRGARAGGTDGRSGTMD